MCGLNIPSNLRSVDSTFSQTGKQLHPFFFARTRFSSKRSTCFRTIPVIPLCAGLSMRKVNTVAMEIVVTAATVNRT